MLLRFRSYLTEEAAVDVLDQEGFWITSRGRRIFIGGVQRKRRPKKPSKPVGKIVVRKRKDGSKFIRRVYPRSWVRKQEQFKFAVMASLAKNADRIHRMLELEAGRDKMSEKKSVSTVALLLMETGMRAGGGHGGAGQSKGEETFGATTLQRRHVRLEGNKVRLDFVGKAGVDRHVEVENEVLAKSIRQHMGGKDVAEDEDPLWDVDRREVAARLKRFDKDYRAKDLRTLKANIVASEAALEILERPIRIGFSAKEKKVMIKQVIDEISEKVSDQLGNEAATSKRSYINPKLIEAVLMKMGLQ